MRISNGYKSLFNQASTYDSEWGNFSGACHKIHEADNNETPSDQPPQSHNNTRELHENMRELHSIPFQDEDLEPFKKGPIPSDFNIQR